MGFSRDFVSSLVFKLRSPSTQSRKPLETSDFPPWKPCPFRVKNGNHRWGTDMQTDIEYETCQQGEWQDCWLISAVVGLAFKRPHEIRGMLQEAGDGCYEVTLPGQDPVVVRPKDEAKATSNGIWAQAIEAAIGQFTDVTAVRVFNFGEGISLLTGRGRTGYTNVTGIGFAPGWRVWSRSAWFEQRVADATARNRLMVLGGSDGYWTTPKFDWLIPQSLWLNRI
jgi:hypothetical protein